MARAGAHAQVRSVLDAHCAALVDALLTLSAMQRELHRRAAPNAEVLTRIDADAARARLHEALAEYRPAR